MSTPSARVTPRQSTQKSTPQILFDTPEPYEGKNQRVQQALNELKRENERELLEAMANDESDQSASEEEYASDAASLTDNEDLDPEVYNRMRKRFKINPKRRR